MDRKELKDTSEQRTASFWEEELIAEIGTFLLKAYTGIVGTHFDRDEEYISTWLKRLESNKRLIIYASSKAQKAVDFILKNARFDEEKELKF